MTNSLQPKTVKNIVDFSKVLNLFDLKTIEKPYPWLAFVKLQLFSHGCGIAS